MNWDALICEYNSNHPAVKFINPVGERQALNFRNSPESIHLEGEPSINASHL